jgi:hypothetical protein
MGQEVFIVLLYTGVDGLVYGTCSIFALLHIAPVVTLYTMRKIREVSAGKMTYYMTRK